MGAGGILRKAGVAPCALIARLCATIPWSCTRRHGLRRPPGPFSLPVSRRSQRTDLDVCFSNRRKKIPADDAGRLAVAKRLIEMRYPSSQEVQTAYEMLVTRVEDIDERLVMAGSPAASMMARSRARHRAN